MVLDAKITQQICDFVRIKPRTVQEISVHIKKNWRTAERYIERIQKETGSISQRVFRGGTRGALKIVFWNSIENIHSLSFQEELFERILHGRGTGDFPPFELYQHIDAKHKAVFIEEVSKTNDPEIKISEKQDLVGLLKKASKQVIIFSGNLSWVKATQGKIKMVDVIRDLAKRNVSIKVVARVSLVGAENAQRLLAINKELGKDMIEIRHQYQPIRGMIIDDKILRMRDAKSPEYYKHAELKKGIQIFYEIYDKDWIEWLCKVFWKMFSTGIPAEKRLKEIETVRKNMFLI